MVNLIAHLLQKLLNERTLDRIRKKLRSLGYRTEDWCRIHMYDECLSFVHSLGPQNLDVLEISGGPLWKDIPFKSFRSVEYPSFDICKDTLDEKFDLIIADQVFEHLLWPYRAGKNVLSMLKTGGSFMVTTPFLIRVHPYPVDCTRWTETGLRYLLAECGFPLENIRAGAWGNRKCIRSNFNQAPKKGWAKRGLFSSMRNEPEFPVSVWAFAQK